jgi:putative SOS response-associated peptidase YedK
MRRRTPTPVRSRGGPGQHPLDAIGEPLLSCTMIVTGANEIAGRVHDRMPVFLAGDSFEAWLDGSARVKLLCSASENLLHVWPVSKRVNRPATAGDDPTLIDRIAS